MTTASEGGLRQDMDAVHARIIGATAASERLPEVNLDEISRIASTAYWTAVQAGGKLEEAERRALSALEEAESDSSKMITTTLYELDDRDPVEFTASPLKKFVYEFFFAAPLPLVAGAAVWLLAKNVGEQSEIVPNIASCIALLLAVLVPFKIFFLGEGIAKPAYGLQHW
jgi:hypothetical protein